MPSGAAPWLGDGLRIAIRWVHAVATAAWVGGSIFYLLVLRPALRGAGPSPSRELNQAIAGRFREVVEASLVALIVSGVMLTFDRLASGAASGWYLVVLGLKILLALAMCWLSWELGWAGRRPAGASTARRRAGRWLAPSRLVLTFGLLIMLLAIVLRQIIEANLRVRISE